MHAGDTVTGVLSLVVPWALLALFIYRARRSRIFLLGIPFLIFMDSSAFFDGMRLFHVPGRLAPYALLTIWLLFVWLLAADEVGMTRRTVSAGPAPMYGRLPVRFLPEESALILLVFLAIGHATARFVQSGDLMDALARSLPMLTMVVGYYLVRDIVGRATRREVVSFLATLIAANTVATLLYIAHQGLHISVYPGAEHLETYFNGQLITRTFTFAPRFGLVILTMAFVLARRRWSMGWGLVLVVTLVGVWISYTRSLLLVTGVAVALSILMREVKHPSARRLTRRVLLTVGVGATIIFSLFVVLPTESKFFEQRVSGVTSGQGATSDSSYIARTSRLQKTVDMVSRSGDLTFGEGFPTVGENSNVANIDAWGADMAWLLVVFYFGIAGVIAFAVVFVGFSWRAFRLFMQGDDEGEHLAITYFVAIVASLVTTGISRSFMEPTVLPMALWLFAFVGAEARRIPTSSSGVANVGMAEA